MSNTKPLSDALYCAIRNTGYTTKDQTDEIVQVVLKVLNKANINTGVHIDVRALAEKIIPQEH